MFKLHAVQAQFGDSLILEFGTSAKRRFVLIDGGPRDNFDDDLDAALREIVGPGGKLDLLALSHIDNDHVVGVLDLLAALEDDDVNGRDRRVAVAGLWHNSFQRTIDPGGEIVQRLQTLMAMTSSAAAAAMPLTTTAFLGIGEGNRLRILARKLKIPVNKGFTDGLILVETAKSAIKLGPLSLRVVGPNKANLEELRKAWLVWLAKAEKDAAEMKTMANADRSVPNLSSIVLLAQCDGKTMLLTGDARGDHILTGLEQAKLLKAGKIHVDVLKVQHHGSNRNATPGFFKTVTADTYVISANGEYDNPDEDTLQWIVEAAKAAQRPITLVVTNATPSTKALVKAYKPEKYGYTLVVKPPAQHAVTVSLA